MKSILQGILILSFLLFFPFVTSQGQIYTVDKAASLKGNVQPRFITIDKLRNNYVSGEFRSKVLFGDTELISKDSVSVFIAKFSPEGRCLWVRQVFSNSSIKINGMSTDPDGNSYLAGSFQATAVFGQFTVTSAGNNDIFIAKFNADGNCLWVNRTGNSGNDVLNGISHSPDYGIYITGSFRGTVNFGTFKLISGESSNIFIARYKPDGDCIWAKQAGGNGEDAGIKIAAYTNGDCCVAGVYGSEASFDSTVLSGMGGTFLTRYDAAGNNIWVKNIFNYDYAWSITGIATDTKGNVFLTANYMHDFIMDRYNKNGDLSWKKYVYETSPLSHLTNRGIHTDSIGNSYIAGSYYKVGYLDTIRLGGYVYSNYNYIARCDSSGIFTWAKRLDSLYTFSAFIKDENDHFYFTEYYDKGAYIYRTGDPFINIASPEGNEIWQTNTRHNITWKSNDDGNLKIELSTDNGGSWITLSNIVPAAQMNFVFTVPPVTSSQKCSIKLTSLTYKISSISSVNFSITDKEIPNLTITSPNYAENLFSGNNKLISWSAAGNISNIKLEYTTDAGQNWIAISNLISASLKEYSWVVPNTPSDNCWVRISDPANPRIYDISDNFFSISPFVSYTLKILSPNNGEVLKAGTQKEIKWQAPSPADMINIYFSSASGTEWTLITSAAASAGTYQWTVPEVTSSSCKIKISDARNPDLSVISDGTFSIWTPFYASSFLYNGLNNYAFGRTGIIFEAYIILPGTVSAVYNWNEAPSSGSLPQGIISVSPFYWLINSSSVSFINGSLKIHVSYLKAISDKTRLVWLRRDVSGDAWQDLDGAIEGDSLVSVIKFTKFGEFAIGIMDNTNPAPILVYPENNTQNLPTEIKFIWSDSSRAVSYRLQISTDSLFRSTVFDDSTITSPSKSVSGLNSTMKYFWRVNAKRQNTNSHYSDVWSFRTGIPTNVNVSKLIPEKFELFQNHPNPFNPVTRIMYSLPVESHVNLVIYNALGKVIIKIVNGLQPAGYREVKFDAGNLSSGIYFFSMEAVAADGSRGIRITKKAVLIK